MKPSKSTEIFGGGNEDDISDCYHCHTKWNKCKAHEINFSRTHGVFVVCEECWKKLTKQERLRYCARLYVDWFKLAIEDDKLIELLDEWQKIKKAVMKGK